MCEPPPPRPTIPTIAFSMISCECSPRKDCRENLSSDMGTPTQIFPMDIQQRPLYPQRPVLRCRASRRMLCSGHCLEAPCHEPAWDQLPANLKRCVESLRYPSD